MRSGPIDTERRRVMVGTGRAAWGGERARASDRRLRFPVDPSSGAFCTIGGMAATNAAGAHTLRYGAMRAWVTALDCIFADGSRALIQRGAPLPEVPAIDRFLATAHPAILASPARVRAHVGRAEGLVRVRARRLRTKWRAARSAGRQRGNARAVRGRSSSRSPRSRARRAASWRSSRRWSRPWTARRGRGWAARARASCSIAPSSTWRGAGRRSSPIESASEAVLLIEIEAWRRGVCGRATAKAMEQAMLSVRRDARHARARLRGRGAALGAAACRESDPQPALAVAQVDAVHRGRAPCRPSGCRSTCAACDEILARHDVRGVIFGHAGDSHVHVNPLIDVRRADWRDTVRAILDEVTSLAATAGRHARRRAWRWATAHPAARRGCGTRASIELFAQVKRAFDPQNIFNPGVKVPTGAQSIGDVKYDPHAPSAPARRPRPRSTRSSATARGAAFDSR